MTDEITLTLPREPDFQRVAHLVLGGLAVRLNLTLETSRTCRSRSTRCSNGSTATHDGDVTVRMTLGDDDARDRRRAAERPPARRDRARTPATSCGLRRVLESTVDDVHVDGDSVRLTKKVTPDG